MLRRDTADVTHPHHTIMTTVVASRPECASTIRNVISQILVDLLLCLLGEEQCVLIRWLLDEIGHHHWLSIHSRLRFWSALVEILRRRGLLFSLFV